MTTGCELPSTVSLNRDPVLDSPLARNAIEKGGHLRVRIEDAAGVSNMTNAEIVEATAIPRWAGLSLPLDHGTNTR